MFSNLIAKLNYAPSFAGKMGRVDDIYQNKYQPILQESISLFKW